MEEPKEVRTDSKTSCADLHEVSSSGREGTKASLLEWQCVTSCKLKKKNCVKSCLQYFYSIVLKRDVKPHSSLVQEVL